MKEILEKLSQYNLFNYLLPGVIYAIAIEYETSYSLIQDDVIITLFICYFAGLIISRIGSLVIEKVLKYVNFIKFKPYKDFVSASHKDPKLNVLSEQNNIYRSILGMILTIVLTYLYSLAAGKWAFLNEWKLWVVFGILSIIFLAAYQKQTKYITQRIEKNLE